MGDHRISVKIEVMGFDGESAEIDWWLNWSEDIPARLHKVLTDRVDMLGLPVEPYEYEESS